MCMENTLEYIEKATTLPDEKPRKRYMYMKHMKAYKI